MIAVVLAVAFQAPTALPEFKDSDIAGFYTMYVPFHTESLRLYRDKTISASVSTDAHMAGEPDPRMRTGTWEYKESLVTLTYDKPLFGDASRRYFPIRWDKSMCLVPYDPGDAPGDYADRFVDIVFDARRKAKKDRSNELDTDTAILKKTPIDNVFAPIEIPRRFLKDFGAIK